MQPVKQFVRQSRILGILGAKIVPEAPVAYRCEILRPWQQRGFCNRTSNQAGHIRTLREDLTARREK